MMLFSWWCIWLVFACCMFPMVAFLCPYHTTDMLWEQPDSPGTGTESSDSSPALLKAFFQSRGNDRTKAVLILPLFWGRERTLQTKDTEIFKWFLSLFATWKTFCAPFRPQRDTGTWAGGQEGRAEHPSQVPQRQQATVRWLPSASLIPHPKSPLGSVDRDSLNTVLDLACLAEAELSQNSKCLAVADTECSKNK